MDSYLFSSWRLLCRPLTECGTNLPSKPLYRPRQALDDFYVRKTVRSCGDGTQDDDPGKERILGDSLLETPSGGGCHRKNSHDYLAFRPVEVSEETVPVGPESCAPGKDTEAGGDDGSAELLRTIRERDGSPAAGSSW